MNLLNYWPDEKSRLKKKTKIEKGEKRPPFLVPKKVVILAVLSAIIFFYLGQGSKQEPLPSFKQLEKLPDVKLPEVIFDFSDAKNADINADNAEATSSTQLKILNANLIGIYEQNAEKDAENADVDADNAEGATSSSSLEPRALNGAAPHLAGLRILGEVKNIGKETVYGAKAIVRFYGKTIVNSSHSSDTGSPIANDTGSKEVRDPVSSLNDKLLATKVASFNQGYQFLPLQPNEVNVYDLIVASPPESETVTVEMKAAPLDSRHPEFSSGSKMLKQVQHDNGLKIKEKKLEPAVIKRGQDELAYFKFSGILINKSSAEIVNPGLYVWLKSEEGKVIGLTSKTFEADLLLPEQELEVNLLLVPVSTGKTFDFEVKTFGEKL